MSTLNNFFKCNATSSNVKYTMNFCVAIWQHWEKVPNHCPFLDCNISVFGGKSYV